MDVICTFVAVPSLPALSEGKPSPLAVKVALAAKDMAERALPSYMLPQCVNRFYYGLACLT